MARPLSASADVAVKTGNPIEITDMNLLDPVTGETMMAIGANVTSPSGAFMPSCSDPIILSSAMFGRETRDRKRRDRDHEGGSLDLVLADNIPVLFTRRKPKTYRCISFPAKRGQDVVPDGAISVDGNSNSKGRQKRNVE